MIYLLSEQRLKKDFLNDNIASELILPSIQTAQDIYLKQTLGSALYETICELVENNSVVEPYKTLLDDYIIVYLEYLAMAELCVPSTFKLGNIGVAQAYDNNVNTQSIQNVKYLESFYKQKASTYENRLVTYIQQNINYFPEYLATNEVVTAKESTLQTGLFLGGTKTKTTKRTTTNKNTLVGAVRYDIQQNLSEQEKEQARENIGVSANGEINVDLDNYYTKDEVFNKTEIDVKLIPYITDNEVNLRLNSYYDKNTVNNLLDNLPIPEYTSELIKDDVYTKNEVDERIANVSSGGSIDLSNYYTKEETYSKEEVNDLVANSGGGSDTPSNIPIVDIMSLTYEEQVEIINYVIDNNTFPDLNTLYAYRGYILNNLTFSAGLWDVELNQKFIMFNLYAHPKSYVIRFITYQWGGGKIYNDINEKDDYETLITKGELLGFSYNDLVNKPIVDLLSLPNDIQANQIDYYSNANVFIDGNIMSIEGVILNGNECVYEYIDTDDGMSGKQVDFYINRTKDSFIIRFIILYGENDTISYDFIYTDENGEMLDSLNLVKKGEVDDIINSLDIPTLPTLATVATSGDYNDLNNLPTLFSGDYNDLENKPQIYTTEQVYNKSEIDLQFAEINTTLGNINNILNTI